MALPTSILEEHARGAAAASKVYASALDVINNAAKLPPHLLQSLTDAINIETKARASAGKHIGAVIACDSSDLVFRDEDGKVIKKRLSSVYDTVRRGPVRTLRCGQRFLYDVAGSSGSISVLRIFD